MGCQLALQSHLIIQVQQYATHQVPGVGSYIPFLKFMVAHMGAGLQCCSQNGEICSLCRDPYYNLKDNIGTHIVRRPCKDSSHTAACLGNLASVGLKARRVSELRMLMLLPRSSTEAATVTTPIIFYLYPSMMET